MRASRTNRARARGMRREPTPAEERVWRALRSRQFAGVKFRRQHPIAGAILDFYAPALRLGIEVDGVQHTTAWVAEADGARTLRLNRLGIEVLRISNEAVIRDPVSLWAWLEAKIEARARQLSR